MKGTHRLVSTIRQRRLVGLAVPVLAALALLVGCDRSGADDGAVTLRFWNGFTGPDGRTMLAMVQRFNRENPDIRVVMQRMDWGTYYNKLFVAGIDGRAPEVFVVHTDTLARLMRGRFVRAVDDLVGPGGIDASDFDANVWQAVARDGRHYAIPLDIHMLGMYYNRKLFREAGIVDARGEPRPPTNREEFLDALRKLRRDEDGDGRPETWGFVFTWLRTNAFSVMRQHGGRVFDEGYTHAALDTPQNVAALSFCESLVREGLAPSPEDLNAWIGFLQGRVGIAFEGIYMLPELQKQHDLDFGAAPLPVLGDQPAAWAQSHNLCLRADLEGRRLDAAKRFVRFLSDNSLDWAQGGQIPVRKSLRDTERFRRMTAQHAFAQQIPYACYLPQVPFAFEYLTEFDLAVERVLRGRMSAQAALEEATARIDRVIQRYAQQTNALARGEVAR